jgi:hypothetical protein
MQAKKQYQSIISFKTAINLEIFLEKRMYNTAVLDGIMQNHSTRIVSQVTA